MKKSITLIVSVLLFITTLVSLGNSRAIVRADDSVPTSEATVTVAADETPTDTPEPTATPLPTATDTPEPFGRPLVVVEGYSGGGKKITAGKTFPVTLTIANRGTVSASNVTVAFTSGDFIARGTGGVRAIGTLNAGQSTTITQELTAADVVEGKTVAYITATIGYTDPGGDGFSGEATLAFNVTSGIVDSGGGGWAASATPTSSKRPQIVISGYKTDVDPLQPGTTFTLTLDIKNVGMADAKGITMVMGGGSASAGTGGEGTPAPGGVAGASGEFTNFAPMGASNIQTLGNLPVQQVVNATQKLIVNVTTNPGTYPIKFSYLYSDASGNKYQDDQVITLLVYRLPLLEVNYYRPADPMMAGQPGTLPIQVVNLSRNSTILGNMHVSSMAGQMMNNVMLIGTLDAGGYYPLDVSFTPDMAGQAEILITIQYTDDFNQPRQLEFKLFVDVADAPVMEEIPSGGGGGGGGMPLDQPETFWQKVARFFKGLFGLDSGVQSPEGEFPAQADGGESSKPVMIPGKP